MDSAAFQEIIALARGTAAELAATEKKVAAFKDELAQQDHPAQLNAGPAMSRSITINPKRSGWIPTLKEKPELSGRELIPKQFEDAGREISDGRTVGS